MLQRFGGVFLFADRRRRRNRFGLRYLRKTPKMGRFGVDNRYFQDTKVADNSPMSAGFRVN